MPRHAQGARRGGQKYKGNPKVAFYAVCIDPSQFSNAEMEKVLAELNLHVPILRDFDRSGVVFNRESRPRPSSSTIRGSCNTAKAG